MSGWIAEGRSDMVLICAQCKVQSAIAVYYLSQ